jgi:hypothetical protein
VVNRENAVEQYLDKQVKEQLAGITRKWVSPGHMGVPDRILIFNGHVIFVEVKVTGGKVEPWQDREHKKLESVGAQVYVVRGKEEVTNLINYLREFA